jgi:hypothetical protein
MSRLRPFLTIIFGLALGIGLGLYLGWVAWPTEFTDANPSVLQDSYRQDYVRLIAAAYTADNDLPAAQQRVASLGQDGQDVVLAITLDTILQGGDEAEIRQLVRLAADLGLSSPVMVPYLPENTP